MAERDPFGRLPDEDSLAGLGSLSDGIESQSTAQPVVASESVSWEVSSAEPRPATRSEGSPADPVAAAMAAAVAAATRTSTGSGRTNAPIDASLADAMRRAQEYTAVSSVDAAKVVKTVGRVVKLVVFVVVLLIIAGVAASIFSAGKAVKDEISSADRIIDEAREGAGRAAGGGAGAGSGSATGDGAGPVPRGLSATSMLRQRNLGPALRSLRRAGLGQMRTLSIRPERLDAQLLTGGGRLRSVQRRYDGALQDFGAGSPGFNHLETIQFSKIDPAAPARLARSAAGRLKRPVSQVDYVVLTSFLGKPGWSVFMRNGKAFQGDARGRITRAIN